MPPHTNHAENTPTGAPPVVPKDKTELNKYQLATINQLKFKIILDANNHTIMGGVRNFYCQQDGLCYRLDNKTGEDIYYTCVDDKNYCHEIRLNDENGLYYYVDQRGLYYYVNRDSGVMVSRRIANNPNYLINTMPLFILPIVFFRKARRI